MRWRQSVVHYDCLPGPALLVLGPAPAMKEADVCEIEHRWRDGCDRL